MSNLLTLRNSSKQFPPISPVISVLSFLSVTKPNIYSRKAFRVCGGGKLRKLARDSPSRKFFGCLKYTSLYHRGSSENFLKPSFSNDNQVLSYSLCTMAVYGG